MQHRNDTILYTRQRKNSVISGFSCKFKSVEKLVLSRICTNLPRKLFKHNSARFYEEEKIFFKSSSCNDASETATWSTIIMNVAGIRSSETRSRIARKEKGKKEREKKEEPVCLSHVWSSGSLGDAAPRRLFQKHAWFAFAEQIQRPERTLFYKCKCSRPRILG